MPSHRNEFTQVNRRNGHPAFSSARKHLSNMNLEYVEKPGTGMHLGPGIRTVLIFE